MPVLKPVWKPIRPTLFKLANNLLAMAIPLLLTILAISVATQARTGPTPLTYWKNLPSPVYIYPVGGAIYYSFISDGTTVHLLVVNYQNHRWKFTPVVNPTTAPISETALGFSSSAAINAGYFNLKDSGASTSYIVSQGKQIADPRANQLLVTNPKLTPYLETIFNRSEVRFLEINSKPSIKIVRHNEPLAHNEILVGSIQAGPQLLPELTDTQEAFIRTDPDGKHIDSIGSHKPAARTAFGITDDGYALLVCVAGNGQNPESSGITLPALAKLMKDLGCTKAINFDGGASSTMFVKLATPNQTADLETDHGCTHIAVPFVEQVVCGKNPATHVKSVLLLQPTGK